MVGPSKTGKTYLITRLLPELKRRGLRVATIKHTHHSGVSLDVPGKDTYHHRQAGAEMVTLASPAGFSTLTEQKGDFSLAQIVSTLPEDLDIILVEGFKQEHYPKIEVVPDGVAPMFLSDPALLALVSQDSVPTTGCPCFKPDDIVGLAELLTVPAVGAQQQA